MKHSDHSWKSTRCRNYLGQLSNPERRKTFVDKDNLTPEQRRRVEELKNRLTYGDSFDETP